MRPPATATGTVALMAPVADVGKYAEIVVPHRAAGPRVPGVSSLATDLRWPRVAAQ